MKKIAAFFAILFVSLPALALSPAGQGRRSMSTQMMAAPRAGGVTSQMASKHVGANQGVNITGNAESDNNTNAGTEDAAVAVKPSEPVAPIPAPVNSREKEKNACINSNIGVGNTFVWASRYSNTGNYASMVEDVENPDNNTCFVRVELKSSDSKVDLSDIQGQYFEMGRTITCGSWADEEAIKKRILSAKKSARTWGTVAGVAGGAAVGVGAMELFGNKLIGGAVQGQKQFAEGSVELLVSQLKVLRNNDAAKYDEYMGFVEDYVAKCTGHDKDIEECKDYQKYKDVSKQLNG